jgi:hypothetical protein
LTCLLESAQPPNYVHAPTKGTHALRHRLEKNSTAGSDANLPQKNPLVCLVPDGKRQVYPQSQKMHRWGISTISELELLDVLKIILLLIREEYP